MMRPTWFCLLASAAGCGDDTPATMTADAASIDAAAACASGELPATFEFHDETAFGPLLSGVRACVFTHPEVPCVDTGTNGTATLCVPQGQELGFSFEHTGYLGTIIAWGPVTEQPMLRRARNIILFPDSSGCTIWQSAGIACPPTDQALLWVRAHVNEPDEDSLPSGLSNVTVSYTPAATSGPHYNAVAGMVDPDATATRSTGNAFAAGFSTDVVTVSLAHATLGSCGALSAIDAWPGASAGTLRAPVRAGFRTFVAAECH